MEYPGSITINDGYIYNIDNPSLLSRFSRADTIVHELAHLWFGDTVTMKWWDDLWLNEAFATFMSYLCLKEVQAKLGYDDVDVWADFITNKNWGYNEDILTTSHPITHVVDDTDEAKSAFDGITYAKGSAIVEIIYNRLGSELFQRNIQNYMHKYAFNNANFDQFITEISRDYEHEDFDLREWVDNWIATPGVNLIRIFNDTVHKQLIIYSKVAA